VCSGNYKSDYNLKQNGENKMKKLILTVLVIATFGANATQLTKEQQARVDKLY
jgi:hypothetical protein